MTELTRIPATGIDQALVEQIQTGTAPKITSIDYPNDDTAASPDGGQTITIHGVNFSASSTVYINGNIASVVGFVNANTLTFTTPSSTPGVLSLYVVNPDGGTAIAVPGLVYSGTPTWTTATGTLGSPYETTSFSVQLQATGDANVTYAVSSGNTIPTGLTLAANGLLSGTIPATDPTTTYTFYVDAIDGQNQETSRSFSVTYTKDTVTWSSPANGAAYSWNTGAANTVALSAVAASGKSITYAVQSGSLPANVSISGANITGTPNTGQTNTSVVIRATAADTNRFADRTLWFTIIADPVVGDFYLGGYFAGFVSMTQDGVATHRIIVSPKTQGQSIKTWKNSDTDTPGATSQIDGYQNTIDMVNHGDATTYPAAHFCNDLVINGYSDWYLPAVLEYDILYNNLKPNTDGNVWYVSGMGINAYSVPKRTSQYTSGGPPYRTSVAIFQEGGAEEIFPEDHQTSTEANASNSYRFDMRNGYWQTTNKNSGRYVRAIRKVAI